MNTTDNDINKQINELNKDKQRLKKLQKEKDIYEDNIIIQIYLNLINEISKIENKIEQEETELDNQIMNQYEQRLKENNNETVYLYIGEVYNTKEEVCASYYELLSGIIKDVPLKDKNDFEKNNKIILLETYNHKNTFNCHDIDMLKKIRKDFIVNQIKEEKKARIRK